MPRRDDLHTILIIGAGPIVIGQGCEFDYSGTQACKALREEGFRIVLINSNPATIMTDPGLSDRTYIEPVTLETVEKVLAREKELGTPIDALLPTLGGQTALNVACAVDDAGLLEKYGVEMIGANRKAIYRAEDRKQFKQVVESLGLDSPVSDTAESLDEAHEVLKRTGLPAIIRPAFTLGGTGGGVAYNVEEFEDIVKRGLDASMTNQVLIDQSLLGWKEYEMEVMRDADDNAVIVCAIENIDPMGVHTGDSITVAPAQTLTDKEYQHMRDASLAILRAIGVETGGSNVQFAINPNYTGDDGKPKMVVVEMNPRVSRSSALASKATGFPIAKIAAKLAIGYRLSELPNDITGQSVACFEPSIDYVVTKIPRWTFEKFPEADETLTTQMKSVGEGMSIGRTFKESLQKGIRSMEVKRYGFGLDENDKWLKARRSDEATKRQNDGGNDTSSLRASVASSLHFVSDEKLRRKLTVPSQGRLYYVRYAFKMGWSIEQIFEATQIDPWFLDQLKQLVEFEDELLSYKSLEDLPNNVLFAAKQLGYSDVQLAQIYLGDQSVDSILKVRKHREEQRIKPVYKLVDTCAAEFEAQTPYFYSTYETGIRRVSSDDATERRSDGDPPPSSLHLDDEIRITDKPKIVILGGGPNRIGQGIEFDYCCVHAAMAARELGFEAVMINSNPETVSTDYDTSDLLFFEPLTLEDVLNVVERLNGGPFAQSDEATKRQSDKENDPSSLRASIAPSLSSNLVRGVIVQFGGQTPLNLAEGLERAGVPIIGTPVASIDEAEDRESFAALCRRLDIRQPENGIATSGDEAVEIANRIGYPVLVRPSFVLGGRAMETVFDDEQLRHYMRFAMGASDLAGRPILIDKFLFRATECDVDVVADYGAGPLTDDTRKAVEPRGIVSGLMEHIEEAGIHSGDSACTIPPYSLPPAVIDEIKEKSRLLARELKIDGLMNVQWAVRENSDGATKRHSDGGKDTSSLRASVASSLSDHEVFIIEVNPRASRTVPFVGKATGVPWASIAAKVMLGMTLEELGAEEVVPEHTSIKEVVFPFAKFPGVDVILGPEMRSTGEVMGADPDVAIAYAKSQMAAGTVLPTEGAAFLSFRAEDKDAAVEIGRSLQSLGFTLFATAGTHDRLKAEGVTTTRLNKISEGRPHAIDKMKNREIALVFNTATRKGAGTDEGKLRATAVREGVPMITTVTGMQAAVKAMAALREDGWQVRALQDYHGV